MKLTTATFRKICGLNGLTVAEPCDRIDRHKTTVYRALKNPQRFHPTLDLINDALPIRQTYAK